MITSLALFDVDGTISINGEIPEEVIKGIRHLKGMGYVTTISTGRGYVRAKEALGSLFDEIVAPEALMIVEHGSKIVNREGKVVFANYFEESEIDHIIDFTRANIDIYRLMWFNPSDLTRKVQVWCYNHNELESEIKKRGHYADVFSDSISDLRDRLLEQPVSNVTLKLKDYVKVDNLKLHFTRTSTNVIFVDGNMEFIRNSVDKAIAVAYLLKEYGLEESSLLLAGNAINDVEMLNVEAGKRILVGSGEMSNTVLSYLEKRDEVIRVNTPVDLGNYLSSL
jgi:HAD superfamily hydrolase (TIGR01484 family)